MDGLLSWCSDPVKGELIVDLKGHLNAVSGVGFSADGQRLISAWGSSEALKIWDMETGQELLTLSGIGQTLSVFWLAGEEVILAGQGQHWQAWRAPSWEEIEAAEKKPIMP